MVPKNVFGNPTSKREAQSEYIHVAHTVFARFGADWHAQAVIISKIFASELRRKFIKSALLVGYWYMCAACQAPLLEGEKENKLQNFCFGAQEEAY